MDLDDVIICSGFAHIFGVTFLSYNFSVKAVHSDEERQPNNMFDGYDSHQIPMYFNRNAIAYHKKEICYEWDKEYYEKKLKELLHFYFDPYKKDAFTHIKRCYQELGFLHKDELVMVSAKAREYLGI